MRHPTRCRRIAHPSGSFRHRTVIQKASRTAYRQVLHPSTRHVLDYRGPTFRQLFAAVNAATRAIAAYQKKYHPAWNEGRFRMLASPEECDRRAQEDLERAYEDKAVAARKAEATARDQAARSAPLPASAANPPPPRYIPPPTAKRDDAPAPLVRLVHSLFGLNDNGMA
jgi:hypothetical protein